MITSIYQATPVSKKYRRLVIFWILLTDHSVGSNLKNYQQRNIEHNKSIHVIQRTKRLLGITVRDNFITEIEILRLIFTPDSIKTVLYYSGYKTLLEKLFRGFSSSSLLFGINVCIAVYSLFCVIRSIVYCVRLVFLNNCDSEIFTWTPVALVFFCYMNMSFRCGSGFILLLLCRFECRLYLKDGNTIFYCDMNETFYHCLLVFHAISNREKKTNETQTATWRSVIVMIIFYSRKINFQIFQHNVKALIFCQNK